MNSTQKVFPLITDANQDNLNMLAQALEKVFGRSFVLRVQEHDNGALHLQAAEQDTGNDYMTPHDLACLLQTDVKSVCRQTETRAQQRAKFLCRFSNSMASCALNGRKFRNGCRT